MILFFFFCYKTVDMIHSDWEAEGGVSLTQLACMVCESATSHNALMLRDHNVPMTYIIKSFWIWDQARLFGIMIGARVNGFIHWTSWKYQDLVMKAKNEYYNKCFLGMEILDDNSLYSTAPYWSLLKDSYFQHFIDWDK